VTKAEIKEAFDFVEERFDRVARRHKSFGQDVAALKRDVALLKEQVDTLMHCVSGQAGRLVTLENAVLAQPASSPPEDFGMWPGGRISPCTVSIAPTPEAAPLPADFPVIAGGRLVMNTGFDVT
jgi:hypothetical protein